MEEQYDVFISYRRDEGDEFAQGFANFLMARGFRVYFDKTKMALGRDFIPELEDKVSRSADFICVVTDSYFGKIYKKSQRDSSNQESSLEEDGVYVELKTALETDGLNIFPILIKDAIVPDKKKLPEKVQEITDKTFLVYNHTFDTYETVFNRLEKDFSNRSKENAFIGILTDALHRVDIKDHEQFNLACKNIINLIGEDQDERGLLYILDRENGDDNYYYPTNYRFTVFYTLFSYYRRSHMIFKLLALIENYGDLFTEYDFYNYVKVEELHIRADLSKDKKERDDYLLAALSFAKAAKANISGNRGIIHAFCLAVVKLLEQDKSVSEEDILEAKKCLDLIIKETPDYGKYYSTRARFLATQNKFEDALVDIKNAQLIEIPSHEDWILRIAEYQKFELLMRIKMENS